MDNLNPLKRPSLAQLSMNPSNKSLSAQQQTPTSSAPSHLTLFERMVQLFEREAAKQKRMSRPDLQTEADDFMEYHNPTLSIRGYGPANSSDNIKPA